MKCTEKERETCEVEKLGCDGCWYNNNTHEDCKYYRNDNGREKCTKLKKLYCKKDGDCDFYKNN